MSVFYLPVRCYTEGMKANFFIKYGVFLFSLILSLVIYTFYWPLESADIRAIKLEEAYAFLALIMLFLAVSAGPLYRLYPNLCTRSFHLASLSGLGISTFYFALLHASINFFYLLKGFAGIGFLGLLHERSVSLGFIALCIIAIMVATSFDEFRSRWAVAWKRMQRFVYLALISIVLHVLMIGSHFRTLDNWFAGIALILFLILVCLYSATTKRFLLEKYPRIPAWRVTAALSLVVLGFLYCLYLLNMYVSSGHAH